MKSGAWVEPINSHSSYSCSLRSSSNLRSSSSRRNLCSRHRVRTLYNFHTHTLSNLRTRTHGSHSLCSHSLCNLPNPRQLFRRLGVFLPFHW